MCHQNYYRLYAYIQITKRRNVNIQKSDNKNLGID
jgi:hypothetical protein